MTVSEFIQQKLLSWIFGFFYVSGLTFLILYFMAKDTPQSLWVYNGSPTYLLYMAGILASIGFIGIVVSLQDMQRAYLQIGLITLIPGILSLIISIYGKQLIIDEFSSIPLAHYFTPFFNSYLESAVPKIWIITIAYLSLGALFFWMWYKR